MLDPEEERKEHMLINKNPTKLFLQLLPKLEVCTLQMSSFSRSCLELCLKKNKLANNRLKHEQSSFEM